MKTRTSALPYVLPLVSALGLACGTPPPEGTATGTDGSTGTATGTASATESTPTTSGSVSDGDTTTASTTQGSISDGQTDATTGTTTDALTSTDPTTGTTTNPVTSDTDSTTDPSASDTDTGSTTTGDTTGDTTADTTGGTTTETTGDTTTDDTTGEAVDCGLQLKATIRDFKIPHPDFETYCCGVVQGLVKTDLGANKKPVFNMAGGMLTDAATFDQWYNNVPDVNQATQITLDLTEIMPGVYSYQNNDFFPIDGQLFGNQGNNHNFHFTTEIHTAFTYAGGESFTFTGDDDVWVFINKKLAIDIGGVHGNTAASVNLDTLGLTVGTTYPLDVFHAERHTVQSNFRIDTTICAVPQ
jgi:fibro-slime domain-containing protein